MNEKIDQRKRETSQENERHTEMRREIDENTVIVVIFLLDLSC